MIVKISAAAVSLLLAFASGWAWAETSSLSFKYPDGAKGKTLGLRTHETVLPEVSGEVYVYATFDMCPANPFPYEDGLPKFVRDAANEASGSFEEELVREKKAADGVERATRLQVVTLGHKAGDEFVPVIKFGLVDDGRKGKNMAFVTPWVHGGGLDYYSLFARPNTPYDYKIHLDLEANRMTVRVSGRGDDKWYLIAENAPMVNDGIKLVNHVLVEQYPGAAGIRDFRVVAGPDAAAEEIQSHPLAKKDRVVGPGRGFRFQSMRSVWGRPGRHVTIRRNPPRWYGFTDVCQVDKNTLACVYVDGVGHGGGGGIFVQLSSDLGRSWGEPITVHPSGANCSRIQKLKDGTLLVACDVSGHSVIVFYDSTDGGKTWANQRFLDSRNTASGRPKLWVPGHVVELSDNRWMLPTSWFGGMEGLENVERLEFYRSSDRGLTWEFHSNLLASPPHNISEPSVVTLPDGTMVVYAREWRCDGFPSLKGYSTDGGKSWKPHELPFFVTGRTQAALLSDGRVMCTFRSGVGRSSLWAWIGDPLDPTGFQPGGAHFNDRHSVGLKDGELHIDNDGVRGQFTQYFLRSPETEESTIDVTFEVKVVSNAGRAATVSVPFVGKFRLLPDAIELAHEPAVRVRVAPGRFHTYRIVRKPGLVALYVDGKLSLETDKADTHTIAISPNVMGSVHNLTFGNEGVGDPVMNRWDNDITVEMTGYSIWRRVEEILDDPTTGRKVISWSASSGRFPDQHQLDHIVEVHASAVSHDQGYSGWVQLQDGRLFVVDYTDDTAPPIHPGGGIFGVSWIRGTYVLPEDLPPRPE